MYLKTDKQKLKKQKGTKEMSEKINYRGVTPEDSESAQEFFDRTAEDRAKLTDEEKHYEKDNVQRTSDMSMAWDRAHVERPFQDEMHKKLTRAKEEISHAQAPKMLKGLSEVVQENIEYGQKHGNRLAVHPLGSEQQQVVSLSSYDQKKSIEFAERMMAEVEQLRIMAAEAAEEQERISLRLRDLTQALAPWGESNVAGHYDAAAAAVHNPNVPNKYQLEAMDALTNSGVTTTKVPGGEIVQ